MDKQSGEFGISRRDFFKKVINKNVHTSEQKYSESITVPEIYKISKKLTLTVLPTPHTIESITTYGDLINTEIQKSTGVIPEYFPVEYERLLPYAKLLWLSINTNPTNQDQPEVLKEQDMSELHAFFRFTADTASRYNKPVYVLDPAHNEVFFALRSLNQAVIPISVWTTLGISLKELDDYKFKPEQSLIRNLIKAKMSRRGFLKLSALFSIIGADLASGISQSAYVQEVMENKPPDFPTESTFRRDIIAKGLLQLGKSLDQQPDLPPQNFVFIYPKFHWQEIKKLLENQQVLNQHFSAWSLLKFAGNYVKNSLFSIREYLSSDNKWQLVKSSEIDN